MELTWMGRYRELVRSLIYYSNTSNRSTGKGFAPVNGIVLTKYEYQILENICEHERQNQIMTDIAKSTGINTSNVTKATKRLLQYKLVERFRFADNKKNIVLKPTQMGKDVYTEIYTRDVQPVFEPFFRSLDGFSDEELATMEKAVKILSREWHDFVGNLLLEKIDP